MVLEHNHSDAMTHNFFSEISKNENYRIKFGKLQIMLYRYYSFVLLPDFFEKIGGYNTKADHFYLSKVFIEKHNAKEIVELYQFTYIQNLNGHSFWGISGQNSQKNFQNAVEKITDIPFF